MMSKAFRDLAEAQANHGGPLGHYWRALADELRGGGDEPVAELPALGPVPLPQPLRDLMAAACDHAAAQRAMANATPDTLAAVAFRAERATGALGAAAIAYDDSTGHLG